MVYFLLGGQAHFSELAYIAISHFKPKNAPDPRRVNGSAVVSKKQSDWADAVC